MRRAHSTVGARPSRAREPRSTRVRRLFAALLTVAVVALGSSTPVYAAPVDPSMPTARDVASADGSPTCLETANGNAPRTGSPESPACRRAAGILLSPSELMTLPTSGPGWNAIMARIDHRYGGPYRLATRDDGNKDVLAHALAGARLDDDDYKDFVRDRLGEMMDAPRDTEDVLGTLRHLQTYIISADLIDLQSFDPTLDKDFRRWLAAEIRFDYSGGGGGGSVISTHDKKPNNFGTHAGATRIAASLYLGDEDELRAARDIWYGWATGHPEYTHPSRVWRGTDWQCDQDRPAGINVAGCTRAGHRLDGVIPEDQERCGEFSWPPCDTNYIHGATDGMTLSFWMLARQGEDPWAWGDRAALRQMQWKYDVGQPPYAGFRWQIPVIEDAYGIDLEGNSPSATSTNFGFADWWAQPPQSRDPGGPTVGILVVLAVTVLGAVLLGLAVLRGRRRRPAP